MPKEARTFENDAGMPPLVDSLITMFDALLLLSTFVER